MMTTSEFELPNIYRGTRIDRKADSPQKIIYFK